MSDDYSAYLFAKQRIAQLHAEARADRLAHTARRQRPGTRPVTDRRTWSARLLGRVSAVRHSARVTDGVEAVVCVDGGKP